MSNDQLQSRHKIGDTVTITAKVAGIQFSDSKVRYVFDLGETLSIVDSEHVEPASTGRSMSFEVEDGHHIGSFRRGNDLPILRKVSLLPTERDCIVEILEFFARLISGEVKGDYNKPIHMEL